MDTNKNIAQWLDNLSKISKGVISPPPSTISTSPQTGSLQQTSIHQTIEPLSQNDLSELIEKAAASEKKEKTQEDIAHRSEHKIEVALAELEKEAYGDKKIASTALDESEMRAAEVACKQAEAEQLHAQTDTEKAKTQIMQWIAKETFLFMKFWCAFVALIVWLYFAAKQGQMEKEVIIALLGTTTISVVGLVGFIVKGLFHVKESNKKNEKK